MHDMEGKGAVAGTGAADDGHLGKTEAKEAEDTATERVCWFINADGTGGVAVSKVADADAAAAMLLEVSLALGEFLEFETNIVLDLDQAMPAITAGMSYA